MNNENTNNANNADFNSQNHRSDASQDADSQTTDSLVGDAATIENLKKNISELEQKNLELNDKIIRNLAEMENVRRRAREENDKTAKFAITNFVSDLVPIVENFFMAKENAPKDEIEKNPAIKNYALAIEMTERELMKILEKNQVKRIYPLKQNFDHNFHEAVASIESSEQEGVVVQVIQAGYLIGERLIRPALVGVAKPISSEPQE